MHEQLLNDLEVWMSQRGVGTFGYSSGGPPLRVFEVMGEFDLTHEEAIAALKDLGQRHRQASEAQDA